MEKSSYDRLNFPRHCYNCGEVFWTRHEFLHGTSNVGKYCSRKCMWEFGVSKKSPVKGKPCSEQRRKRVSEAQRGEKHYNWKGGITEDRVRLCNTNEYRNWRKTVYQRDWYRCVLCGEKKDIQAHHILDWSNEKYRFNVDNGITLCRDCHTIVGATNFHPLPKVLGENELQALGHL